MSRLFQSHKAYISAKTTTSRQFLLELQLKMSEIVATRQCEVRAITPEVVFDVK